MRPCLAIDLETYSEVDLLSAGVYAYAEHESFEIMLLGWAIGDDDVGVVDLTSGQIPMFLLDALLDPAITKTAWNANFERTCLANALDCQMPPEQWQDTMILAAELGLPRSLADAGRVLGLPEDQQKMKEGKDLIRYFAKPCKPTKANGQRTRNLPEHAPDKWQTYIEYNRRDVETERAIRKKLLNFGENPGEQKLWQIDQDINDLGVRLDERLASQAADFDLRLRAELEQEAKAISGLENPKSVQQIKNWILEETGIVVESLEKKQMASVLERVKDSQKITDFLEIRSQLSKTSTAKYDKMLTCVCGDHRIHGLTQFYGANRTGRWAGRLVQMQNLPQNKLPDEDLDNARELVKAGEYEAFQALYDPKATLSQLIRTAFVPRPGCKFIVADFSAIEARVLAWLAGETWRLDVFNTHGKIYEASAEKMFHLPPGSVKKGDPMRQKGKIAELALGYGGSVGALKSMGALDMGLEEEELKPLVDQWRAANPHITRLWWDADDAFRKLLVEVPFYSLRSNLSLRRQGPLLRLRLPSGRELSYVRPRLIFEPHGRESITYEGIIQAGGWGRMETYGPKIVENIVQATARDCLAESMKRLHAKRTPMVFHVHDEIICEVPEDEYTADDIAEIMSAPIKWADGLPMRADAYECEYYRKD